MRIMIDDTYGVGSDAHNFTLFKTGVTKTGKDKEEVIAYCSSPQSVLKKYIEMRTRQSDCTTFKEFIELLYLRKLILSLNLK